LGAVQTGKLDELTPRELEVLTQIARGRGNAEIAAAMYLSEATIKTHVSRILANSISETASKQSCSSTKKG
jgi:DNA-binding NarL/FixJ family response regulator